MHGRSKWRILATKFTASRPACLKASGIFQRKQGFSSLQEGRSPRASRIWNIITRSPDFDLGRDRTRIKDARDGLRQQQTVDVLLHRFFNPRQNQRFEIQVLADEVGMGKTFVALGVAY